ncbi:hypothetical protein ABPG77_002721 [Micractinium sp. CCAP 211/92]
MLASPASPREAQADAEGSGRGGKGGSSKLAGATVFENPLASHPIPADAELPANASSAVPVATPAATPPRPKGGGRRRLDVAPPSPVSSLGTASAASAGASGRGLSAPPEGHVRRLTQNLVEILESLSGSVALPGQHHRTASTSSSRDMLPGVAGRGDSFATMADLEQGRSGQSSGPGSAPPFSAALGEQGSPAGNAPVVPMQHVRRLTNTLVDILRHVAASGQPGLAGDEADPEITPLGEATGLLLGRGGGSSVGGLPPLPDGPPSEFDDRLSLSSAATASTAGGATDAGTALLRAAFLKDEYRGDDVKPFFYSGPQVLASSPSRKMEDLEEAADQGKESAGQAAAAAEEAIPHRLVKKRAVNPWGLFVFVFFLAAFGFYVWARAAHTLGLGSMLWYGVLVLMVEIMGGLAMLPYGLCLTMRVTNGAPPLPDDKGQVHTVLPYHIRVIIPCYKEPLDVIQKTVTAALVAPIPAGCTRTVYLLDDGRDIDKKKFMRGLGVTNAVYVSGRKRAKGEMNGKSANINNAAKQIYPEGHAIPLTEVLCVFDADQVPNADFFLKMVPLLDGGQDVGMILSPQTFYNLNPDGDIFNHANVHFWDYTQPGYDALGLISCTGTNFLVRARAFQQAGWFPEWTLTEDFALASS